MTCKEKAEHLKFYRKGLHDGNPFFCFTRGADGAGERRMLSIYPPFVRTMGLSFYSYRKGRVSISYWYTAKNGNHVSRSIYTNHYKV